MCPKGFGLIARTACEGKKEDELLADLDFLRRMWESIQEKAGKRARPPYCTRTSRIIFRVIRDLHAHTLRKIVVDDPAL